jgi:predicted DNA-binding transcriptional regulator YafY
LTSATLARELEVARRTILRDVDALTEAGLPVIMHKGNQGGIELGFNYRTRLTGLAADEAEAMAVMLNRPLDDLVELGVADAANRARRKLIESFPDQVRERIAIAARRFRFENAATPAADPRLAALADAVRGAKVVRLRAHTRNERTVHPVALIHTADGWCIEDNAAGGQHVPLGECGDINVSALTFRPKAPSPQQRA